MKTTLKKSLENKLLKLLTEKKIKKASIVYGWIKELIEGKKEFRPVYTQGSNWNSSSLFDRRIEMTNILGQLKIEYKIGNDALRGGQTGAFIQITTKVK